MRPRRRATIRIPVAALLVCAAGTASAAEGDDPTPPVEASPLFARVRADDGLSLHRDMYALPATWSDRYEGSMAEVVFQLSAKIRLHRSRFFLAYTQRSFWQAWNASDSRPFRETNHDPEIFYRRVPTNSAFERFGLDVGLEHESNGQSGDASRSWNRLYVAPQYHRPRFFLYAKVWYRLPEDRCRDRDCRDEPGYDDNPDITDFLGYAEVQAAWALRADRGAPAMLQVMVRGNPATGKGALAVDIAYPAGSRDLFWFARYFEGYGDSLIDYDRSLRRIGLGVLLKR